MNLIPIEKPIVRHPPEEELLNSAIAILTWLETATLEDFQNCTDLPYRLAIKLAITRFNVYKELQ